MTLQENQELVRIITPTDDERNAILEIIELSFKDTQMNRFIFNNDLTTQRLFHLRKLGPAFDVDPAIHKNKRVEGAQVWAVKDDGIVRSVMVVVEPGRSRGDSKEKLEYERIANARLPIEKGEWIKNERNLLSQRAKQSINFDMNKAFNLEIIATHPSFRQRGLGKLLIHKLISLLDVDHPYIWLTSTHYSSVRFYQNLGLEVVFEDDIHFGEETGKFRGISYDFSKHQTD